MSPRLPTNALVAAIVLAALVACGGERPELDGGEAGRAASSGSESDEPTSGIARKDPRLLLYDVQTALESARTTDGEYPTNGEFSLEDRWRLLDAALDEAFEEWSYSSDGESYRLVAERDGKRFEIHSPSGPSASNPPPGE